MSSSTPAPPSSVGPTSELRAVRVDPETYAETDLGTVVIGTAAPFTAEMKDGGADLRSIIDEANKLE